MSSGTFADKAKEHHLKQISRQKRIVFGERPTQISAQTLRTQARFNEEQENAVNMQSGLNVLQGNNNQSLASITQT